MRKNGFTLAEVLITLSIIGVVAALTIPSLTRNFQETQYKTSFKKIYSDIAQATPMVKQEYGSITDAAGTVVAVQPDNLKTAFCHYLKCTKQFDWHSEGSCAPTKIYELDGEDTGTYLTEVPCAILANGATILFGWHDTLERSRRFNIDVNGLKGPNTIGLDIFMVQFTGTNEELKPTGYQGGYYTLDSGHGTCLRDGNSYYYAGYSCAAKVMQNIDY